jgi:NTE family protein
MATTSSSCAEGDNAGRISVGLSLSGGGSRAIAFHLGCLRALHSLGVLSKVGVLSTISGGSVIGAYYAYTPQKTFEEFESDIQRFLQEGFQSAISLELLKPHNLVPSLASFVVAQAQEVAARVSNGRFRPVLPRFLSRTDMFRKVLTRKLFPGRTLSSTRRQNLDVVIGACELRLGEAFRFGNRCSGSWRLGTMVNGDVPVAFAVAASAAYPIFLPAFDRRWKFCLNGVETEKRVVLTDGGIYDNLGVQTLEPGRDSRFSLHNFPCENLVVCNAGLGQESGDAIPMGFLSRVQRSFEIIHRRVQDSTMKRLHHLKSSGLIRGFAMPYLGQQDAALPVKIEALIPREDVVEYPTDFAAMPTEWIEKLSGRGEQLTRALVKEYLSYLLEENTGANKSPEATPGISMQ